MEIITDILSSREFAAFAVASISGAAVWLARTVRAWLVKRVSGEQLRLLFTIAERAVQVAEQTGGTNEEKLAKAVSTAQTFLDAYGIRVDAAQLAAAIEAAVYTELTRLPLPEPPRA